MRVIRVSGTIRKALESAINYARADVADIRGARHNHRQTLVPLEQLLHERDGDSMATENAGLTEQTESEDFTDETDLHETDS